MFAQVTTQLVDTPGFGASEWIAIITGVSIIVTGVTALIVQMARMRKENTDQHKEGRALVTDVRDRLLDVHTAINQVDHKVDNVAENLQRHEHLKHRPVKRRLF